MTTTQAILQHLQALPEPVRREVLDFVEFLQVRRTPMVREHDVEWSAFSLSSAMRGMEDEDSPYTAKDIKESFR